VSWLIWGGDEGIDWALEKSKTITESKSLFEEFLLEKGKKSKPKTDKQKIKDLSKKQKGLAKKAKDIKADILDLSKDKEKEPTDKLQSLLLKTQMTQSAVDAKKAEVQIQQISLKAKLKTAKTKEKALKDAEKDNPKPEAKPKEKPVTTKTK
jgi:cell division protein FtsN